MQVLIDNFARSSTASSRPCGCCCSPARSRQCSARSSPPCASPPSADALAGTSYINVFRNTPLLLILLLILNGGARPRLHLGRQQLLQLLLRRATIGLGLYAAAFVCEALRSGINSIPLGQAEAARAIGMTFSQSMTSIILPQAFRAVIPPLTSTYIALAKNTSVALAIGVTEASFALVKLRNDNVSDQWSISAVSQPATC